MRGVCRIKCECDLAESVRCGGNRTGAGEGPALERVAIIVYVENAVGK